VCRPFWEALAVEPPQREHSLALVVVTPSPALEDRLLAEKLLPSGATLHMSSDTWFAYGVTRAGTFALATARPGSANAWEQPGEVLGLATLDNPGELAPLLRKWLPAA
jgi:hypothetical protein